MGGRVALGQRTSKGLGHWRVQFPHGRAPRRTAETPKAQGALMAGEPLKLWFWTITDELTKRRRQTTYRMTEAQALERFGTDAVKVEGSLEVRQHFRGHTSDFLRNQ